MKDIIKKLYPLNRVLIGGEEDIAMKAVSKYLPLKYIKVPSGTKCFTWTVPEKWEVTSATLTDMVTGKTIIDYKNNPLHLYVGSLPYEGAVTFEELDKHLRHKCYLSTDMNAIPYVFKYYDYDWGFCLSENQYKRVNKRHRYKVSINTKYSKGKMLIGESTVKGKSPGEVLLIAHLDHPYQANDNLSAVAIAIEVAKVLKRAKLNLTVKVLFLPETIGSIAYAWKHKKELSKVKAVIALDILGNKNRFLIQKTFDNKHFLNYLSVSSCKNLGLKYDVVKFRDIIGSDELIFSDPEFNIPGLMLTTWPYAEYHTHFDSPDIIDEETLINGKDLVIKIITNLDRNFIPRRKWQGPLMRSKIGWFLGKPKEDRQLELFGYKIDGKKSVIEIAEELDMDVDLALGYSETLKKNGLVR